MADAPWHDGSMSQIWYADAARHRTAPPLPGAARDFHASLPGYAPTPLVEVPELAAELGVAAVWVKDESARLGIAAFKILGASWAVARLVAERTGAAVTDLDSLRRAAAGSGIELVTATDGNHGRAVARMARLLGLPATVFLPAVTEPATRAAIAAEGAHVVQIDSHYDDAVASAAQHARQGAGRELVQDTAWEGYEQAPAWIVEGYDTLLAEIDAQLGRAPDLVAVPVGVGSLAQAVVAHYPPTTAVLSVEPDTAACLLASLRAGDRVSVPTADTVMAGLNCGTVSSLAWPVLRDGCDAAVTVTDSAARRAGTDLRGLGFSSGPTGAATLAGVRAALGSPDHRVRLGLDASAVIVVLNTEGAAEDR